MPAQYTLSAMIRYTSNQYFSPVQSDSKISKKCQTIMRTYFNTTGMRLRKADSQTSAVYLNAQSRLANFLNPATLTSCTAHCSNRSRCDTYNCKVYRTSSSRRPTQLHRVAAVLALRLHTQDVDHGPFTTPRTLVPFTPRASGSTKESNRY
jgi:hypothetical protein